VFASNLLLIFVCNWQYKRGEDSNDKNRKIWTNRFAKWLRDKLGLVPGDKLQISVEGNGLKLEPLCGVNEFVRKRGVLVFTWRFSEAITAEKVNEIIDLDRNPSSERHPHSEASERHAK
jgi:hypothetical protein